MNETGQGPRSASGRARALWRQGQAVQLAADGHSYDEIARQVGYANRGTAWRAVNGALSRQVVKDVEMYRLAEVLRLNRIIEALMPAVFDGDLKAIDQALRAIGLRIKILGLDKVAEEQGSGHMVVDPDHPAFNTAVESPAPGQSQAMVVYGNQGGNGHPRQPSTRTA